MTLERYQNGRRVVEGWNSVFRALCAEPRRQLVVALADADGDDVPLPESAVNPNVPVDTETIRTRLLHRDLPLLAEHGFVEYEEDPFRAVRGPRFEEVAVVMESLQSRSTAIPDRLVVGCNRLERERQTAEWDDAGRGRDERR